MSWPRDSDQRPFVGRLDEPTRTRLLEDLGQRIALGDYRVPALDVADAVIDFYDRGSEDSG